MEWSRMSRLGHIETLTDLTLRLLRISLLGSFQAMKNAADKAGVRLDLEDLYRKTKNFSKEPKIETCKQDPPQKP